MKRNLMLTKLTRVVLLFAVVITVFAFGYVSGSAGESIPLKEAQQLYKNNKETVKAVYVDRETLQNFNALLMANTKAQGVRLYFGKDAEQKAVNFTVAVFDDKDDVSTILKASGASGVCPKLCDKESPITN